MSVRAIESSPADTFPFPPRASTCASPAMGGAADEEIALEPEAECPPGEFPTASGCLRGFCWAVGIEAAAALCGFLLWYFRFIWR
jgi:hypothetical protein